MLHPWVKNSEVTIVRPSTVFLIVFVLVVYFAFRAGILALAINKARKIIFYFSVFNLPFQFSINLNVQKTFVS
tara:strand:+ start:597 stop:815 length:219 start_codon:yes stop_codon:yes gene_type:complete